MKNSHHFCQKGLSHQKQELFIHKRLIYQNSAEGIKIEQATEDEIKLSLLTDEKGALVNDIEKSKNQLGTGEIKKAFENLRKTLIPNDQKEAIKVLEKVNHDLKVISNILSDIAFARTGGIKTIPGTDLPELKTAEVNTLLNMKPEDALSWLNNNSKRNNYIGMLRVMDRSLNKPFLEPKDAKKYRDMPPAEALAALKNLHDQTKKSAEANDQRKADNDLDEALSKLA